jgi:hypothetical protein
VRQLAAALPNSTPHPTSCPECRILRGRPTLCAFALYKGWALTIQRLKSSALSLGFFSTGCRTMRLQGAGSSFSQRRRCVTNHRAYSPRHPDRSGRHFPPRRILARRPRSGEIVATLQPHSTRRDHSLRSFLPYFFTSLLLSSAHSTILSSAQNRSAPSYLEINPQWPPCCGATKFTHGFSATLAFKNDP